MTYDFVILYLFSSLYFHTELEKIKIPAHMIPISKKIYSFIQFYSNYLKAGR